MEPGRVLSVLREVQALGHEVGDDRLADAARKTAEQLFRHLDPITEADAALVLGVRASEVREWVAGRVLVRRRGGLDPRRLYEVMGVLQDIRRHPAPERVWWRLADRALLDREDLRTSLEQLRAGQAVEVSRGVLVTPVAQEQVEALSGTPAQRLWEKWFDSRSTSRPGKAFDYRVIGEAVAPLCVALPQGGLRVVGAITAEHTAVVLVDDKPDPGAALRARLYEAAGVAPPEGRREDPAPEDVPLVDPIADEIADRVHPLRSAR